jgi:hypothetical protein
MNYMREFNRDPEKIEDISKVDFWGVLCIKREMGKYTRANEKTGVAEVNLIISYTGLLAVKESEKKFGTPYVAGVPMGDQFAFVIEDTR